MNWTMIMISFVENIVLSSFFYVLAVNRDLINRDLSTLLVVIGSQSFFFSLVSFVTSSLEAIDTCMAFSPGGEHSSLVSTVHNIPSHNVNPR